jgi:hypothetical protein
VRLPLREAFLAFSDPVLTGGWQNAMQEVAPLPIYLPDVTYEQVFDEFVLRKQKPANRPRYDPVIVAMADARDAVIKAVSERKQKAWQAVERDFRNRIASGEVVLEGLQCAPTLATSRSVIPSLWAELLIFHPVSDQVETKIQKIEFMKVTAFRAVRQVSTVASAAALTNDLPEAVMAPSPRPRGRTSYEPLIEAVLRANWEDVQRRASSHPEQRPIWSELARAIHKRLRREQRKGEEQIPHEQTIRTRLPQIYARLLSEKPVRK